MCASPSFIREYPFEKRDQGCQNDDPNDLIRRYLTLPWELGTVSPGITFVREVDDAH